jgi:hypothetical protein
MALRTAAMQRIVTGRPALPGLERIRLTALSLICDINDGGSRKGSKGNAVRARKHTTPRLPPQL